MTVGGDREAGMEGGDREAVMEGGDRVDGRDREDHHEAKAMDTLPIVTIHGATPSPAPDPVLNDDCSHVEAKYLEDIDDDDEFDEDETMGEEEEEEEEQEREMTTDEKRDMYLAVRAGDVDQLEDCLDRPHANINMLWFRENLLMTSIRDCNQEMAEFLLDNGVDHTYITSVVGQRESANNKRFDVYEIGCRQMAYDYGMYDIVNQIDLLQNKLFPFIRLPERSPRYRRPKPSTPTGSDVESGSADYQCSAAKGSRSGSETDTEGSASDKSSPRPKRRKKRGKKKPAPAGDETGDSGINKTAVTENNMTFGSATEVDSGHNSMGSSKLRIHMVREHEKLTEKEETSPTIEDIPSPRRSNSHSSGGKGEEKSSDHSEKSETPESKVNDEGYGSISQKSPASSPSPELKTLWTPTEPSNRIRGTKSALSIRKSNFSNYFENQNIPFDSKICISIDEPLHWRKITTVGSYAKESKNWHVKNNRKTVTGRVDITPLCLSSPSLVPRRSILRGSSASTTSTGKSLDRVSSAVTEKSDESSQSLSSIASYMRPTRSTVTKQRLSPSFVRSYSGLDFTRVMNSADRPLSTISKRNAPSVMRCSVPLANSKSNQIVQKRNNPVSFRI